jgi:geranylgeranyl diphosphate synthase type II
MTGSDEQDGKVTYVTMHGLEKSTEDVRRMSEEALELYDSLTVSNDFLRELIVGLITRTK